MGYHYLGRPVRTDDGDIRWEVRWDGDGPVPWDQNRWPEYIADGEHVILDRAHMPPRRDSTSRLGIAAVAYQPSATFEHRAWQAVFADARKRYGARKALSEPQPPDAPGTRAALNEAARAGWPQPQVQPPAGALWTGDIARHAGEGIGTSTVRAYLARHQMPAPDGYLARSPWWHPATIERWLAARPGPGNRTPRK